MLSNHGLGSIGTMGRRFPSPGPFPPVVGERWFTTIVPTGFTTSYTMPTTWGGSAETHILLIIDVYDTLFY